MQYDPQTYVIAATAARTHTKHPAAPLYWEMEKTLSIIITSAKLPAAAVKILVLYLVVFELKFDANGGSGAPATLTHSSNSKYEKSYQLQPFPTPYRPAKAMISWVGQTPKTQRPQRDSRAAPAWFPRPFPVISGGSVSKTLYAVWKEKTVVPVALQRNLSLCKRHGR